MAKKTKAFVKNAQGEIVKIMEASNRGEMFDYCGQKQVNGLFYVYVPSIGIVSVVKSHEPHTVVITGVVVSRSELRMKILEKFANNKKLAVMFEKRTDFRTLQTLEIPVNTTTVEIILDSVELNTANKKFGVIVRDVNNNIDNLMKIGKVVFEFDAERLEEIYKEYKATGSNNGNFSEYLISGDEKDIFDRFRPKKNDLNVKLEDFKSIRHWELKTTLKKTNKAVRSGASSSNFLIHKTHK